MAEDSLGAEEAIRRAHHASPLGDAGSFLCGRLASMVTGSAARRYEVAAVLPFGALTEDGFYRWRFTATGTGVTPSSTIDVLLDEMIRLGVIKMAGLAENDEGHQRRIDDAVSRFAVQRIRVALELDPLFEGYTKLFIQTSEINALVQLIRDKTCAYQVADGRDLYCSAASTDDETATAISGLRRLAPTSRPVCLACDLPSTDHLCSYLSHPQIIGFRAGAEYSRQLIRPPLCDLGRKEIFENAGLCRAGGHACWRYIVEPVVREPAVPFSPLGLGEAFDHLDAVWQLTFGKGHRLLRLKRAAEVIGLTQPCATLEEFDSRASDLIDVIKALEVQDADVPEPARSRPKEESLNRLAAVLQLRLAPDDRPRADRAIGVLRAVTNVRVAAQHGGAAAKGVKALAELGIDYPIRDYAKAWDQIRSKTVAALTDLREAASTIS